MARCLRFVLLLLLVLAPLPSQAAGYPGVNLSPTDLAISGLALTTSPQIRIRVDGWNALTVYLAHTRAAATAVNMTCTSGPTQAVQAPIGVAAVASSGAIAMAAASWSYPVSASGVLRMVIAPLNDVWLICTLSGTAATSGDLVTAYGRLGGVP